jgi:hypothetical protein
VVYNICSILDATKDCGADFEPSRAYAIDTKTKKCTNILPRDDSKNDIKLRSKLVPGVKETEGFVIQSKRSDFSVSLVCDSEVKSPTFDFLGSTLIIRSYDACGTVDQVSKFISQNRVVACLIIIVMGLALLFFGGIKWDLILGIFGFVFGTSGVLFFFFVIVEYNSNNTSFLIIGALALVIGSIVGYLAYNATALSYIIIGFPSGYLLTAVILMFLKATFEDVG